MKLLKLVALDAQDLPIVSAHVQDGVTRVGDLAYELRRKRFVVIMNRLAWETVGGRFRKRAERRQSVLSFDRVLSARASGIDRGTPSTVLSLLAIRFVEGAAPAGTIELVFADAVTIELTVECIEVRLADLGGTWEASSVPRHGT